MALFSRKSAQPAQSARSAQPAQSAQSPAPEVQPPDALLAEGRGFYAQAKFAYALESYGNAIDKLHTMYTFPAPSSRRREPGASDQPIIDGFVSALGAALASGQGAEAQTEAAKASGYLDQIARFFSGEGNAEAPRYAKGVDDIRIALKSAPGAS